MSRSRLSTLGVAAGLGDACAGIGLLLAPAAVAELLGLHSGPQAEVWLRWIGAFVLAVGWSTLVPTLRGATREELRGAHRATATSRIAVAGVLCWLVGGGDLPPAWLGIAAWDATVAALQHHGLRSPERRS